MSDTPDAIEIAFNAAVSLLADQSDSRIIVVGYQRQKKGAEVDTDPTLVQLWVSSWGVDWSRSSRNGQKTYNVRIEIQFTIAQPGTLDIAVIQDLNSTPAERTAALLEMVEPAQNASKSMFEASKAVREIFDDARNLYLGLPDYSIEDKAYSDYQQDDLPPRGGLGILTGVSFLEFRVKEEQLGDTVNFPDVVTNDVEIIGTGFDEQEDEETKQGVTQTAP